MGNYAESERELTAYFTSNLGVGAQSYDSGPGGDLFDSNDAAAQIAFGPKAKAIREHRTIEWTLEQVSRGDRATLHRRFHPHRIGAGPYQVATGGIAALMVDEDVVRKAFAKWQSLSPKRLATALAEWLDDEATRPGVPSWWTSGKERAEDRLSVALAAYEVERVKRVRAEAKARKDRDEAVEREHQALLGGPVKAPASVTRIRAPKVRPAVVEVSDVVAQLFARQADLLKVATEQCA